MLEYTKKEKSRRVTERWKELETRLAKIRADEEKRRKVSETAANFQKRMVRNPAPLSHLVAKV